MGRYRVTRRYQNELGEERLEFAAGDVVTLADETAAWIERDSPGTLVRIEAGGTDRMMRRERARGGDGDAAR